MEPQKPIGIGRILKTLVALLACNNLISVGYVEAHGSKLKIKGFDQQFFEPSSCQAVDGFTDQLINEIDSYAPTVKRIADLVLNKKRGNAYDELALFTDTIGPRLSGSKSLAQGIEYMLAKFNSSKLDNVHGEPAMVPRWERGNEWAQMVEPMQHKMDILALGTSVGTMGKVLQAEVVPVKSWTELDSLGNQGLLNGKIVLYNVKFTTYGETVQFRSQGASKAAQHGAVAALVRSVTPFSIYSAHTGSTSYSNEVGSLRIPTAAVTLEDADLIQRWINRNRTVSLKLYMEAQNYPNVESANVIGDITGKLMSDNFVVVSGHIDSWDITNGALDDGGGMMISYLALSALRELDLRAKRTVRAILWTSEEFGYWGARQYFENRKKDNSLAKHNAVFESDLGTFTPLGLGIAPNALPLTKCISHRMMQLFKDWDMNKLDSTFEGSDIDLFADVGVPSFSLANKNDKYFYFHHTRGDSMSLEDPDDLDKAVFLWAATSFVLADLSVDLPKKLTV